MVDLPQTHELKSWPKFFEAVLTGAKKSEVRRNDRGFALGDALVLREWDPKTGDYTGRSVRRIVCHLSELDEIGIPGFVLLCLRRE